MFTKDSGDLLHKPMKQAQSGAEAGGCTWVQDQHKSSKAGTWLGQLVSLCQLPYVLSPEAKARIMQGEALLQKQHQAQTLTIQVRPNMRWTS